jgi:hypothetical protein
MDEVQRMVDHARGHTELLNDMLVNSSGGADEFERAMIRDLAQGGRRCGWLAGVGWGWGGGLAGPGWLGLAGWGWLGLAGLQAAVGAGWLARKGEVSAAWSDAAPKRPPPRRRRGRHARHVHLVPGAAGRAGGRRRGRPDVPGAGGD